MCFDYTGGNCLWASSQTAGSVVTPGFRQANSRQESRKSAKRRDNDTEIRDRLTPPPTAVCSLARTSFYTHTLMHAIYKKLCSPKHKLLLIHKPIQANLSRPLFFQLLNITEG